MFSCCFLFLLFSRSLAVLALSSSAVRSLVDTGSYGFLLKKPLKRALKSGFDGCLLLAVTPMLLVVLVKDELVTVVTRQVDAVDEILPVQVLAAAVAACDSLFD